MKVQNGYDKGNVLLKVILANLKLEITIEVDVAQIFLITRLANNT